MPNKGNYLFDMAELIQRPLPEQRAFELEYYDFLSSIPSKIDAAFEMTRAEMKGKHPLSINRSWFANTLNGNVVYLLGTSYPEFLKDTGRGSYCLKMNFRYEGYVKKLVGKKLFPQYNHSNTSLALTNQKALPDEEPVPIIYIGYTLNKTNDLITGYHAVCIKGKDRIWRTDLTAIALPNSIIMEIIEDDIAAPVVTVKAKGKKKTG